MIDVQIRTQDTPNPDAKKYILNKDVILEGTMSFLTAEESETVPLARDLINLNGVESIYMYENIITVNKNESADWDSLEPLILSVIETRLPAHNPRFKETLTKPKTKEKRNLPKEAAIIESILDLRIRPGLQGDGGDLDILDYNVEDKILTIEYHGACGSCPSATMGTLYAIQSILQDEFDPEIQVQIEGMDMVY